MGWACPTATVQVRVARAFPHTSAMENYHMVGPNEALAVSGGCCGSIYRQYMFGGWA
jgi:hypothetical protein